MKKPLSAAEREQRKRLIRAVFKSKMAEDIAEGAEHTLEATKIATDFMKDAGITIATAPVEAVGWLGKGIQAAAKSGKVAKVVGKVVAPLLKHPTVAKAVGKGLGRLGKAGEAVPLVTGVVDLFTEGKTFGIAFEVGKRGLGRLARTKPVARLLRKAGKLVPKKFAKRVGAALGKNRRLPGDKSKIIRRPPSKLDKKIGKLGKEVDETVHAKVDRSLPPGVRPKPHVPGAPRPHPPSPPPKIQVGSARGSRVGGFAFAKSVPKGKAGGAAFRGELRTDQMVQPRKLQATPGDYVRARLPGSTPEQIASRQKVLADYYRTRDMDPAMVHSHTRGAKTDMPVDVYEMPDSGLDGFQHQYPGQTRPGNYTALDPGTTPSEVGVDPWRFNRNTGQVEHRMEQPVHIGPERGNLAMETTAEGIPTDWTNPVHQTTGGARQVVVMPEAPAGSRAYGGSMVEGAAGEPPPPVWQGPPPGASPAAPAPPPATGALPPPAPPASSARELSWEEIQAGKAGSTSPQPPQNVAQEMNAYEKDYHDAEAWDRAKESLGKDADWPPKTD